MSGFPALPAAPKMSKTKSLHMMCKSCIYDKAAPGTWREQVENCSSSHCPLWQHRPMTTATITLHRQSKTLDSEINIDSILAELEDEDNEATA